MFGVDSAELFLIILVAVMVIGPKDLPRVMRTVGQWIARARGMADQFRSGMDQMVRDSEIGDIEQKWREHNDAIMQAHPLAGLNGDWGLMKPTKANRPAPEPPVTSSVTKVVTPRIGKAEPVMLPAPTVPDLVTIDAPRPPDLAKTPPSAALAGRPPAGRRAPRLAPARGAPSQPVA